MKETIFGGKYVYLDTAIFESELSGNAMLVYCYLCKCANKEGTAWPAHKTIAYACSLSVSSVKTALEELKEQGKVNISPRYREEGGKSSNLYTISRQYQRAFSAGVDIFTAAVSSKAKLVYLHLCKCADKEGLSWPSHRTIASSCAIGMSTVRKAIKELLDCAIVFVQSRFRGDKGQTSNFYKLLQIAFQSTPSQWTASMKKTGEHRPGEDAFFFLPDDSQRIAGSIDKIKQGRILKWL